MLEAMVATWVVMMLIIRVMMISTIASIPRLGRNAIAKRRCCRCCWILTVSVVKLKLDWTDLGNLGC